MTAQSLTPPPAQRRGQLAAQTPSWRACTLAQHFDAAAVRFADRPLVIGTERSYTYQEMMAWSRRLASGLVAAGIQRGDNVAMIMANHPEFVVVKLALARIGATAVPINFLLRRTELRYVLEQSDSVALLTMNALRDLDYLAELDAIIPHWETHGGGATLPQLRQVFVLPVAKSARRGFRAFDDLAALATPASDAELCQREAGGDPASCSDIVYTSGTTGRSKGVMLTHDMVLRTAYASAYTRAFEDGRRIVFALPMYHVFGYVECLVACSYVGGAIVPLVSFDPEQMLTAAERHHASEFVCVPTMTLKLIEVARRRGFRTGDIVNFFNSGGLSPASIWEEIRATFAPQEMTTAYGMSETTASTSCVLPEDSPERLQNTHGRLKPAGIAGDPSLGGVLAVYKCVNPETGVDLPVDVAGEFMVRGPSVTRGYYNKPEETSATIENGWLHTGDIGVIDADGYLTLLGRIKESYRCGGEMVIPLEIEELVNQHPQVTQALVVGVPDSKMGEVGCLCVIAAGNCRPDRAELIALCAAQLARFKVPKHVLFITAEDVPVTATGRPQKFKLAELARLRLAEGSGSA
jgi:fatty-acyl-CoA synthase